MRLSTVFARVLLLSCFLATGSLSAESIRREFSVSPGGALIVNAERTAIEVVTSRDGQATIEVIPQSSSVSLGTDFEIDIYQTGNDLVVEIEYQRTFGGWFDFGRRGLKLVAAVPHHFNVELKTSGGGITVDDRIGDVKAGTSGGGIQLGRIEGPVEAKTSGGGIELSYSTGPAYLRTSGGGIKVGDVSGDVDAGTSGGPIRIDRAAGNVRAKTSGGGITVHDVTGSVEAKTSGGPVHATISEQPLGDCILSTSGGGIDVRLAGGLSFEIDAKTSGGGVRADLSGLQTSHSDKSSLRGTLNSGGPKLVLRTSGGGIQVKSM